MWHMLCVFGIGIVTSTQIASKFETYPKTSPKKSYMGADTVEVEPPVVDSSKRLLHPENDFIVVPTDYVKRYVDRKNRDLVDKGFKFKKKFTLSEMFVRTGKEDDNKTTLDLYGTKVYNNTKRRIKILFDDIENNIITINPNVEESGSKFYDEWEPVACEGLESIQDYMFAPKTTAETKSTSIFWESLHYDGTEKLGQLYTKNHYIQQISKKAENIDTIKDLKNQAARILDKLDSLTEQASKKLERLGKEVDRVKATTYNYDDIQVVKHVKKNHTQQINGNTDKISEVKQEITKKLENMDFESLVMSTLNTTINNNNNDNKSENKEIVKTNITSDSHEPYGDLDIIELLNQTSSEKQKPQNNELKIELHTSKPTVYEESFESHSAEDIFQSDILPGPKGANILIQPHRTTNYNYVNRRFHDINDTFRDAIRDSSNFSLPFEKSDVLFDDLLLNIGPNNNRTVTPLYLSQITTGTPTLTSHRKTKHTTMMTTSSKETIVLPLTPTRKFTRILENDFVFMNQTTTIKKFNETYSLQDTRNATTTPYNNVVSMLVYKYKKSLSSTTTTTELKQNITTERKRNITTERIETTPSDLPTRTSDLDTKLTSPVIDYDYLLYNHISDKAVHPQTAVKTTIENLSHSMETAEHDGRYEWNDYNNDDEVLNNDDSNENSKWYKVIPLSRPEMKKATLTNLTNFESLYTHLIPTVNQFWGTSQPKPKRTAGRRRDELIRKKSIEKIGNYSHVLNKNNNRNDNGNVPGKGNLNLKIHRNSTAAYTSFKKETTKPGLGINDIINSWSDTTDDIDYEFLDKPVTDILQPRDMYLRYEHPYNRRNNLNKRNIKSTLYNQLFKTPNVTSIVKVLCHKDLSKRAHKNMVKRTLYRQQRQIEPTTSNTPVDNILIDAKPDIVAQGNKAQSSCWKNVFAVDEENILPNEVSFSISTPFTEETTMTTKNELTIPETMQIGTVLKKRKPFTPKLILEDNQPPSKHAKYLKKSQIKLGDIWKFMERAGDVYPIPKKDDDDIDDTSEHSTLLTTEAEVSERQGVRTIKLEPNSILAKIISRTTTHPISAFIKTIDRIDNGQSIDSNKTGSHLITEDYETTTVPITIVSETQIPTDTNVENKYVSVTPYKLARELIFVENETTETPFNCWAPMMYMKQLTLKTLIETELPLQTNEIDRNASSINNYKHTTQGEPITMSNTKERPEPLFTNLNDPLLTSYSNSEIIHSSVIAKPAQIVTKQKNMKHKSQLNLKTLLEKESSFQTKKVNTNAYSIQNLELTASHTEPIEVSSTEERPEQLNIHLNYLPSTTYWYSESIDTSSTATEESGQLNAKKEKANNKNQVNEMFGNVNSIETYEVTTPQVEPIITKQTKRMSSMKRGHVYINTVPTFASHYRVAIDRLTKQPNIINTKSEKHYLSFFAKTTVFPNNDKENISATDKKRPVLLIHNSTLHLNENKTTHKDKIMTLDYENVNNSGKFEFNVLQLHVPYSFRQNNVPMNTNFTTDEQSTTEEETPIMFITETNKEQTTVLSSTLLTNNPVKTTNQISREFENTVLTIPPKSMPSSRLYDTAVTTTPLNFHGEKSKLLIQRFVDEYQNLIPRLDTIFYLPTVKLTKGEKKEKIMNKEKHTHSPWILNFLNNERQQKISTYTNTPKNRELQSTVEGSDINLYLKKNISNNILIKPKIKMITLPQNKPVKVAPLGEMELKTFIKKSNVSLKNYDSTNTVYSMTSRDPNFKLQDVLFLREEARAKEIDEYRLWMMKRTTTNNPNKDFTEWSGFKEQIKFPATVLPFIKITKESIKEDTYEEFPNYQDMIDGLDIQEQEAERRDLRKFKRDTIEAQENANNTNVAAKNVKEDENNAY